MCALPEGYESYVCRRNVRMPNNQIKSHIISAEANLLTLIKKSRYHTLQGAFQRVMEYLLEGEFGMWGEEQLQGHWVVNVKVCAVF